MGHKHRCTGGAAAPAPKDYGLFKPDKKVRPCYFWCYRPTDNCNSSTGHWGGRKKRHKKETGKQARREMQCSHQRMLLNLLLKTTGFSNLTKGEALLPLMLQANRQLREFKDKGTLAKKTKTKGKQANRELQQFNRTLGVCVCVGGGGGAVGRGGVRNR